MGRHEDYLHSRWRGRLQKLEAVNMDDLIRLAREGDTAARDELLAQVRPQLRQWAEHGLNTRFAGRIDASDLTQITLLEVHEKLHQFVGTSQGELIDWLRRVLERNILDEVRRATAQKRNVQREQRVDGVSDDGDAPRNRLASDVSTPSMQAIRGEETDRLREALDQLSPDHRLVVQLVHLQGQSLSVAAEQLQRTPAATAKLLQRGMASLRKVLQEASAS
jgi:RNA polymerase sigma-70 factor (ECF subfamily)